MITTQINQLSSMIQELVELPSESESARRSATIGIEAQTILLGQFETAGDQKAQPPSPSMPVYPNKLLLQAAEQMDNISNSYRVQLTAEQAVAFLETADPQCECWNINIADFARAINEAVPRMQFAQANPNNGQSHHHFLVGREYTRVIYLDIAKAYLRNIVEDYAAFIQQLEQIGRDLHAYEIDVRRNDDGAILIRYWWDRCDICE